MLRVVDSAYETARLEERLLKYFPDAVFRNAETLTLREIFMCLARQYRMENSAATGAARVKSPNLSLS
jgi:hypothetical protein